ncbi:acyltransferase family protein [Occallatibacter savannae]|uniref:acyltransferase family protein n=1 Tax=Occallatibacter savannae TaxID=1002691 RepID=UPI0013A530F5|nr:acyltransferase family protein [Occallatibacter savannae]
MPETAQIEPITLVDSTTPAVATRDLYIDRLRTIMTALVILHHAAITYGASGSWFYNELHVSGSLPSILLTLFVATNQSYFMGFFFLLAGYFTPGSLERKGSGQFIADRFTRLGIPLLAFIFILGPLTAAMVAAHDGKGFWNAIRYMANHTVIINGPLWFAQALLIFSLIYCAGRAAFGSSLANSTRPPQPVPPYARWLLSAILIGAASLVIRQFVPVGQNIIGLQLGFFAPYIFLFSVGIAAWRNNWIRQLQWKHARPWVIMLIAAWPVLPISIAIAMRVFPPEEMNFAGGHTWPAIIYSFWDPFVSWGMITAWLLIARATMNKPSALWSWLNRRAYAVFIIHPPVLVGISLLLQPLLAPAILKFVITGTFACIATWLIADPLVRLPVIRRIV